MSPDDPSQGANPVVTWSVGELHEAVGSVLRQVFGDEVWVEGELCNLKRSAAGHVYFDLAHSDEGGGAAGTRGPSGRPMLAVTLFAGERHAVNRHLRDSGGAVRMTDGVRVRIRGRLDTYPARSTLQLRMTGIDPGYTLGVLGLERDRVLAAVTAAGLLERNAALAMSSLPLHVGLVTSVGSAAHADALDALRRGGFGFRVSVFDARTQGADAERSLVSALGGACAFGVDVILLVRGGGARTDLAAFDTESVARAIAAATVPVWTGIGHEIDTSVADVVAHSAHTTPTAAAAAIVAAVRGAAELLADLTAQLDAATRGRLVRAGAQLDRMSRRSGMAAARHLDRNAQQLDAIVQRVRDHAPRSLDRRSRHLSDLHERLGPAARRELTRSAEALEALGARAAAHDPGRAFARGWTITRRADSSLVRDPAGVAAGERLTTTTAGGTVLSTVDAGPSSVTEPAPDRPTSAGGRDRADQERA